MHGVYQGNEFLIKYDYYVFHYVEVYYVSVIYSDGKRTYTKMERRTRTLYRYGLLHDFNLLKNIAVVSSGGNYNYPKGWQTTSKKFNDMFSVYADNEMTASKFLKPAVIIAFIELTKHLGGINTEINSEGKLNIAFSDDDVLELERKYSIASLDEFEKEINSMLKLPKLTKLLEFIEILKKFNDDNF